MKPESQKSRGWPTQETPYPWAGFSVFSFFTHIK